MDKNPIIKPPEIDIEEECKIKKTKRNKKETVCSDKRRSYGHCGICGSSNTAVQGVDYCKKCGKEEEFLSQEHFFRSRSKLCDCFDIHKYRNKEYKRDCKSEISVTKCLDCGSVEGVICPSCGRDRYYKCWSSKYGEKYCRHCSLRKPGYLKKGE